MASSDFMERHRVGEKAFTRDRKLPLPQLVRFLLNLRKGANQDELDRFFEVVCEQPLADSVSKSALTQARAKLRPEAFSELSDVLVNEAMRTLPMRRWHGFRLLAVDGSTFLLPKEPAIVEAFGQTGEVTPQARFSRLYDVLNRVIVAADIEPLSVGERILAGEYLPATRVDDLLLYDRGYPAFWLFASHAVEQRHFCVRVPRAFCTEVEAFAAGGARSAVIELTPCDEARRQCQAFGLPTEALRLRLIRVHLKSGEEEFLITSLLDEEAFPTPLFKHLYHLRWGIEIDQTWCLHKSLRQGRRRDRRSRRGHAAPSGGGRCAGHAGARSRRRRRESTIGGDRPARPGGPAARLCVAS
ncbi:IS4 family transposase [Thiocapsa rosea]|nr:IS4 family transposase [Thiocapsa rosea]